MDDIAPQTLDFGLEGWVRKTANPHIEGLTPVYHVHFRSGDGVSCERNDRACSPHAPRDCGIVPEIVSCRSTRNDCLFKLWIQHARPDMRNEVKQAPMEASLCFGTLGGAVPGP